MPGYRMTCELCGRHRSYTKIEVDYVAMDVERLTDLVAFRHCKGQCKPGIRGFWTRLFDTEVGHLLRGRIDP